MKDKSRLFIKNLPSLNNSAFSGNTLVVTNGYGIRRTGGNFSKFNANRMNDEKTKDSPNNPGRFQTFMRRVLNLTKSLLQAFVEKV